MSRERELLAKGFEKRTPFDEPRLSEVAEMYEEMGYEVVLEPFDPEREDGCSECMKATPDKYKVIYTRKKESV